MTAQSAYSRFGSGKSVRRVEDDSLLTGRDQFADNFSLPGPGATSSFVRSPHAHARIAAIDAAAADRRCPAWSRSSPATISLRAGVKPIVQSADFKRANGAPTAAPPQHALAIDAVRYVGEAVAAVVAETREQARDAAEAIDVRYEPLPTVADLADAIAQGRAARVARRRPATSPARSRHGNAEAATLAIAAAAHVVTLDLVNQRLAPGADRAARHACELRRRHRSHHAARSAARRRPACATSSRPKCSASPTEKMRVLVGDVGGGFGMKTTLYARGRRARRGCARALRAPGEVDRRPHGGIPVRHARPRSREPRATLALDEDGKILALRVHSHANLGAYATPAGAIIQLMIGPWVSTSVYDIHTIDVRIEGVLTNTTPTGPVSRRGTAGGDLHHRAADGRSGAQVRHRSRRAAPAQHGPSGADAVQERDGQDLRHRPVRARARPGPRRMRDWDGYPARAARRRKRGRLRGRGIATFVEWTGADVFERDR